MAVALVGFASVPAAALTSPDVPDVPTTAGSDDECSKLLGINLVCASASVSLHKNYCVDGPGVDQKKCYWYAYWGCSGSGLAPGALSCYYFGPQNSDSYSCQYTTTSCGTSWESDSGYTIVYGCQQRTISADITAVASGASGTATARASDSLSWDFC